LQSYYTDNRFPTSLTPLTTLKQQAFALSYGDIQSLDKSTFMKVKVDYSTLLDFTAIDANLSLLLASVGRHLLLYAGAVYNGNFA
jgi:hypothetical protein